MTIIEQTVIEHTVIDQTVIDQPLDQICDPTFDHRVVATEPLPTAAARCADGNGTLTALFFSDHVLDIARAKAICAKCVLRERCLSDALERQEPWGVWGGELLSGGRVVAVKRPCGRPPKVPRPELVVDEMGVPVAVADAMSVA